MIIYKWTNKKNGKIYVGQTVLNASTRIARYRCDVKQILQGKYKGKSKYPIVFAMAKHGFENFEWEVLDVAMTTSELNEKEIYWINALNCRDVSIGYNIAQGGRGLSGPNHPSYGKKLSAEVKKQIGDFHRGKIVSKETKKRMSEGAKARWRKANAV